jgi:hypothetical protein
MESDGGGEHFAERVEAAPLARPPPVWRPGGTRTG